MHTGTYAKWSWVCVLILGAADRVAPAQSALYVDGDAPTGGDGTNWSNACQNLQDALAVASSGQEIRVAGGTYKPDRGLHQTTGDRNATFRLIRGVGLYGGYAGYGQPDPDRRDITLYETVLSGDLLGDDGPNFANVGDNSFHVVTADATDASAILDGFVVTSGNAPDLGGANAVGGGLVVLNGSARIVNCRFERNRADYGGGLHCNQGSPIVVGCSFRDNAGLAIAGAVYNSWQSAPVFLNCTFNHNTAMLQGGALANSINSDATLINCGFYGNSVASYGGGAVVNSSSNCTFVNCVFSGNVASNNGGGALRSGPGSAQLINCTLYGNHATSGGGVFNFQDGQLILTNCVLWANTDSAGSNEAAQVSGDGAGTVSVNWCCIQGWTGTLGGTGDIDTDPLFVDPDGPDEVSGTPDDDLRLRSGSPCIDASDSSAVPTDTFDLDGDGDTLERLPYDFAGNPRFVNDPATPDTGAGSPPIVDIGAYEYRPAIGIPGDMNCDGVLNGQDIDGFVYVLFGAPPYTQYYEWTGGGCNYLNGDFTCDNTVNGQDIDGFVAALFGG